MKKSLQYGLAVFIFCLVATVLAQPASFPFMNQSTTPLSKGAVDKAYNAYRDLLVEFKDYQADGDAKGIGAYLQANNASSKADKVVSKYGFQNTMQWYESFMRVIQVYAAHKMQASKKQMPQLKQQLAEIRKNKNMTQEQKDHTIKMLETSQNMMNASPEDIKVIEPYIAKFDALLDK